MLTNYLYKSSNIACNSASSNGTKLANCFCIAVILASAEVNLVPASIAFKSATSLTNPLLLSPTVVSKVVTLPPKASVVTLILPSASATALATDPSTSTPPCNVVNLPSAAAILSS